MMNNRHVSCKVVKEKYEKYRIFSQNLLLIMPFIYDKDNVVLHKP